MSGVRFTPEQEQWLRDNYHKAASYADLSDTFNSMFFPHRTACQLRDKCAKSLGLIGMPNKTRYGEKPKEQCPIGTVRKSQTGTYIKVRMVDRPGISGYAKPWWLPLQEKVYRDVYGEIPDGYMVCFLDHNTENFSPDNLYPITRKTAARLAQNKWWSVDPEITMAAIKWCEYNEAIKKALE